MRTGPSAHGVRFIYASSAATYGDGAQGFSDADETTRDLRPINMYGYSKQLFDLKVLRERIADRVAGIKFFNVFGPNEYHKGDMTSVIFKAFHQIRETGKVRLFKSYKPEYPDGGQKRDFVYVKDCVEVLWWLLNHKEANGIFNLGTGKARTWNDLIGAVFAALGPSAADRIHRDARGDPGAVPVFHRGEDGETPRRRLPGRVSSAGGGSRITCRDLRARGCILIAIRTIHLDSGLRRK